MKLLKLLVTCACLTGWFSASALAGSAAAERTPAKGEIPPRKWSDVADGFASVHAMGQNGTTGGAGWDTAVRTQHTWHHNWFRNTGCRNPRAGQVLRAHLYNNYLQNVGTRGQWASDGTNMILQNSVFENVNNPHRGDQTDQNGTLVATGNIYRNTRGRRETRGPAFFDPGKFYEYTLDEAKDIPGILAQYAGPQENIAVVEAPPAKAG